MYENSFWPAKSTILNLGQDAPSEILKKQASFLPGIDYRLIGIVEEYGSVSASSSLENLPFSPLIPVTNVGDVLDPTYAQSMIAFQFSIGRQGKTYRANILKLRFSTKLYYPVEVWDSLNLTKYQISNKSAFENCLKHIFNSNACLQKLRYILSDNIA